MVCDAVHWLRRRRQPRTERAEFDTWKWVKPEELPELVVPFMRRLYLDILAEFREFWLEPAGS